MPNSRSTGVVQLLLCWQLTAGCGAHVPETVAAAKARPDVLYVFEYDGSFDWTPVHSHEPWTASLAKWLTNLPDRSTQTFANPAGAQLKIPSQWWLPDSVSPLRDVNGVLQDISLAAVITGQLAVDNAYFLVPKYLLLIFQLSFLRDGPPLTSVHVTMAREFWHAIEATAEAEQLVYKSVIGDSAQAIIPVTNYVVLLSMNWAMHGQNSWQGNSVSVKYQDHSLWDTKFLDEILRYFFDVAQAKSFPSLDEFAWRVDKVAMLQAYQNQYNQNPDQAVQPIPSQVITPLAPGAVLADLCYSARYTEVQPAVAAEHVHATVLALLHAAHLLEADPAAQQIQQHNQGPGTQPVRKYFLKRNLAGVSSRVTSITLRNQCTWQHNQLPAATDNISTASQLDSSQSDMQANMHSQATNCQHNMHAVLHDAQQLFEVAELLIRQSCQEVWLMQPYIPDIQEYRVYLIGGANAKAPHEVVPVFTPSVWQNEGTARRHYAWNVTLPTNYFSAASGKDGLPIRMQQLYPNGSQTDIYYQMDYFPYPIWRDEDMYNLLVTSAFAAAAAINKSGWPIRTGQHVMLRVDLILTTQGQQVKPFVNEAHLFNDAGIAFDVRPSPWQALQDHDGIPATNIGASCAAFLECNSMLSTENCVQTIQRNLSAWQSASGRHIATASDSKGMLLMRKVWDEVLWIANS